MNGPESRSRSRRNGDVKDLNGILEEIVQNVTSPSFCVLPWRCVTMAVREKLDPSIKKVLVHVYRQCVEDQNIFDIKVHRCRKDICDHPICTKECEAGNISDKEIIQRPIQKEFNKKKCKQIKKTREPSQITNGLLNSSVSQPNKKPNVDNQKEYDLIVQNNAAEEVDQFKNIQKLSFEETEQKEKPSCTLQIFSNGKARKLNFQLHPAMEVFLGRALDKIDDHNNPKDGMKKKHPRRKKSKASPRLRQRDASKSLKCHSGESRKGDNTRLCGDEKVTDCREESQMKSSNNSDCNAIKHITNRECGMRRKGKCDRKYYRNKIYVTGEHLINQREQPFFCMASPSLKSGLHRFDPISDSKGAHTNLEYFSCRTGSKARKPRIIPSRPKDRNSVIDNISVGRRSFGKRNHVQNIAQSSADHQVAISSRNCLEHICAHKGNNQQQLADKCGDIMTKLEKPKYNQNFFRDTKEPAVFPNQCLLRHSNVAGNRSQMSEKSSVNCPIHQGNRRPKPTEKEKTISSINYCSNNCSSNASHDTNENNCKTHHDFHCCQQCATYQNPSHNFPKKKNSLLRDEHHIDYELNQNVFLTRLKQFPFFKAVPKDNSKRMKRRETEENATAEYYRCLVDGTSTLEHDGCKKRSAFRSNEPRLHFNKYCAKLKRESKNIYKAERIVADHRRVNYSRHEKKNSLSLRKKGLMRSNNTPEGECLQDLIEYASTNDLEIEDTDGPEPYESYEIQTKSENHKESIRKLRGQTVPKSSKKRSQEFKFWRPSHKIKDIHVTPVNPLYKHMESKENGDLHSKNNFLKLPNDNQENKPNIIPTLPPNSSSKESKSFTGQRQNFAYECPHFSRMSCQINNEGLAEESIALLGGQRNIDANYRPVIHETCPKKLCKRTSGHLKVTIESLRKDADRTILSNMPNNCGKLCYLEKKEMMNKLKIKNTVKQRAEGKSKNKLQAIVRKDNTENSYLVKKVIDGHNTATEAAMMNATDHPQFTVRDELTTSSETDTLFHYPENYVYRPHNGCQSCHHDLNYDFTTKNEERPLNWRNKYNRTRYKGNNEKKNEKRQQHYLMYPDHMAWQCHDNLEQNYDGYSSSPRSKKNEHQLLINANYKNEFESTVRRGNICCACTRNNENKINVQEPLDICNNQIHTGALNYHTCIGDASTKRINQGNIEIDQAFKNIECQIDNIQSSTYIHNTQAKNSIVENNEHDIIRNEIASNTEPLNHIPNSGNHKNVCSEDRKMSSMQLQRNNLKQFFNHTKQVLDLKTQSKCSLSKVRPLMTAGEQQNTMLFSKTAEDEENERNRVVKIIKESDNNSSFSNKSNFKSSKHPFNKQHFARSTNGIQNCLNERFEDPEVNQIRVNHLESKLDSSSNTKNEQITDVCTGNSLSKRKSADEKCRLYLNKETSEEFVFKLDSATKAAKNELVDLQSDSDCGRLPPSDLHHRPKNSSQRESEKVKNWLTNTVKKKLKLHKKPKLRSTILKTYSFMSSQSLSRQNEKSDHNGRLVQQTPFLLRNMEFKDESMINATMALNPVNGNSNTSKVSLNSQLTKLSSSIKNNFNKLKGMIKNKPKPPKNSMVCKKKHENTDCVKYGANRTFSSVSSINIKNKDKKRNFKLAKNTTTIGYSQPSPYKSSLKFSFSRSRSVLKNINPEAWYKSIAKKERFKLHQSTEVIKIVSMEQMKQLETEHAYKEQKSSVSLEETIDNRARYKENTFHSTESAEFPENVFCENVSSTDNESSNWDRASSSSEPLDGYSQYDRSSSLPNCPGSWFQDPMIDPKTGFSPLLSD